ncbi:zinc finger MYM-type protein 1-like [Hydra vulgaris]|uniref:Zinc finger MYM-type protein 1-like n=1 Tax=Hydra vulgaris TaxID=6087 RepID=A0ABM4DMD7_HYDVU
MPQRNSKALEENQCLSTESKPTAESSQLQNVTDNSSMNNASALSNSTEQHENVSYGNQLEDGKRYWREVLRQVVECLKFLCNRGLALRGDSEEIGDFSKGNFLGAWEFLAKFDPFLAKHLESRGNQGRGNVSYILSTSYEEIVFLMAKKVLDSITSEIACAKYFSLIVDSSTDTSHCDQLAIIILYVSEEDVVEERLIGFESSCGHSGKAMADAVKKTLDNLGLNIKDARGQTYDNASKCI